MEVGQRFIPFGFFKGVYIPNVILQNKELSANDKLVWASLCLHAGENGVCYPKQSTIADELGISERTVRNSINILVELEFLEIEKPSGKDKLLHLNNKYYFIWNTVFECTSPTGNRFRPEAESVAAPNKVVNNKVVNKPINPPTPLERNSTSSINRPTRSTNIVRPTRPTLPHLHLFPTKFQSNKDFKSIWKEYLDYRSKDKKHPLTEQAVKLMLYEINSNNELTIESAIERIVWCITNTKIAPNFKPWKNNQTNKSKGEFNNGLDPKRFDHLIEER